MFSHVKLIQAMMFATSVVLVMLVSGCVSASNEQQMALGDISVSELLADYEVFKTNHENFTLSEQELGIIQQWPSDLSIEIYFGSWCHDSEREVPKLLKVLQKAPSVKTKLIALDYQKLDPSNLAANKGIKYTPTIIVYRKEQEIGRIIERPKQSLVQDIQDFL